MSNKEVDLSEIKTSIRSVMNREAPELRAYVAHEMVHTFQSGFPVLEIGRLAKHRKVSLLNACLTEGVADFVTQTFPGLNSNKKIHDYAEPHRQRLMEKAIQDQKTAAFDYRPWLYNYANPKAEYPDLGYYVGFQLAQNFYNKTLNPRKSFRVLVWRGQYKRIVIAWTAA